MLHLVLKSNKLNLEWINKKCSIQYIQNNPNYSKYGLITLVPLFTTTQLDLIQTNWI